MKIQWPLPTADLKLMQTPALVLVTAIAIATALTVFSGRYQRDMDIEFSTVQASYQQVRTSIQQIAQEEETVVRYIDRYRRIEDTGLVSELDRLGVLEGLNSIRSANLLYPLQIAMNEEVRHPLSYPAEDPLPGVPVNLTETVINVELALLHEVDLLQVLDQIIGSPGLYQPNQCSWFLGESDSGSFELPLRPNMRGSCTLRAYNFDIQDSSDGAGVF